MDWWLNQPSQTRAAARRQLNQGNSVAQEVKTLNVQGSFEFMELQERCLRMFANSGGSVGWVYCAYYYALL